MTTQIKPEEVPDSPAWWNRQLTYIMDETYHALEMSKQGAAGEVAWIKRAEYLRNKAIECVENAYKSIQLQIEEDKENE
ncbi:MAG: hypothetical protein CL489_06665 [Acidobacteria bacterium]|nr:hypothetical protein [Acidobacteriota bacterium]